MYNFLQLSSYEKLELSSKKGNKEAEHILFHLLNDEECNCNN
ncbi:hypothetical protein [Leptotrichia trevisanii]|nr:hypothetical protein [Leptotrichia trevisanii]